MHAMPAKIKIGTRGSELALWQANHVAERIGHDRVEIVIIKTQGDRIQNVSFDKMEGKGFFTKEIEEALLARTVDLAVHSMKDLPVEETPGLVVAAVLEREDPSDVLLVRDDRRDAARPFGLPAGAVVGTSSLRRAAQIRAIAPDIDVRPLRGNVGTRIRRLAEKRFDAIMLARAGLVRLAPAIDGMTMEPIPLDRFLPAPAQGALALQVRADDAELIGVIRALDHADTRRSVTAERSFLMHFGGGCQIPLGAYARLENGAIILDGVVASRDGITIVRGNVSGSDPERVGADCAHQLKKQGADSLL